MKFTLLYYSTIYNFAYNDDDLINLEYNSCNATYANISHITMMT
jgi:hypothetical protein